MSSDFMKYEEGVLQDLSDQLSQFAKDLGSESTDFHTHAKALAAAWEGNAGLAAFQNSVKKWDTQFGPEGDTSKDTAIGLLNTLSQSVSQALQNAKAADNGVKNAFSAYE
ncbi:hypothetical protein KO481_42005 [Nocardia sp. NEAU-G5]|uniref:WXG100 family type VII secretion target n=1 Tax=Nocardia albiluteola TaxID=2842303 RepID=A0ABS6BD60_9NOCA|nr:hypothetical protein [Nocardia albiluteola]MBU3068078.1 hypothetical protein [Nocardia albiluteola]